MYVCSKAVDETKSRNERRMRLEKQELWHPTHPQHKLEMEQTEKPFLCDGCKEAGIGCKYTCNTCNFDLHKACALAPPTQTHPFYTKCCFHFYTKPPGAAMRVCDACRRDVLGFVYHCSGCGFDLHPCCISLPRRLSDGHQDLILCIKISAACHRCGWKGLGWCYRSECKSYSLHVSCVKELLVERWQVIYANLDKHRVRVQEMRIPSLRGGMERCDHGGRLGRVQKCCLIAGGALRIIISAILGDPTAVIAAVVGGFLSR